MATPCASNWPSSRISDGAWSSIPTDEPPVVITRSPATVSRASRMASRSSDKWRSSDSRPPSRSTKARNIMELESTIIAPVAVFPGFTNSLPVISRATDGRRNTRNSDQPIDAKTPRSCGLILLPGSNKGVPLRMSSPIRPTCRPGVTASVAVITPSSSRVYSAINTASHPSGMGAPVMMRTAAPAPTLPSNTCPGVTSPTTLKVSGL